MAFIDIKDHLGHAVKTIIGDEQEGKYVVLSNHVASVATSTYGEVFKLG